MQLSFPTLWVWLFIECVNATRAPAPAAEVKRAACNKDNLLNALQSPSRLSDSYKFCSAYIGVPPTSIVTVYTSTCILSSYAAVNTYVHPVYLYNLQPVPYTTTAVPIVYNSVSPSPSTIPGGPQYYQYPGGPPQRARRDESKIETVVSQPTPPPSLPQELLRRDSPALPSYIATTYPPSRLSSAFSCLSVPAAATSTVNQYLFSIDTTTTCTNYIPTQVATYAAYCAPSLQVNAPSPNSHANYRVVPSFHVNSKMDCCKACSAVFNCVWWEFDFGTVGDGWMPGTCHYAYYTGRTGDAPGNQPAVCPNGITQGISLAFRGQIGRQANNNDPGYNYGPCGNAYNVFESNQDSGLPDDYNYHYCGQPDSNPSSSPPGCA